MSDVLRAAERLRRRLAARDERARRRVDAAYADAYATARGELDVLLAAARARVDAGREIPVSWLYEAARLPRLLDAIRRELTRGVPAIESIVRGEVEAAAVSAGDDALTLLRAAVREPRLQLATPPSALVTEAVGQATVATRALRALPADAAARIERALVRGIALQRGPERIYLEVAAALDGNRARARTIARTEFHRVHREATRVRYQQAGGLVAGWEWLSSLDRRCCAACVAMHGTVHALDEPMGSHPNCRCTMLPVLRERAATGALQEGPAVFASWPAARQLELVGPRKLAAIRAHRITLPDLVSERHSPVYGVTRTVASLQDALAHASRRRFTDRAAA